jgi:hypothetical protein
VLQEIPHDDARLTWQGVVSMDRTNERTVPWRLPREQAGLFPKNVAAHGERSSGMRIAFRSSVIGFARIIRDGHPNVPLVIISPIIAAMEREEKMNAAGLTLPKMREEVEEAVRLLREYGDEDVHYVNGLELMGPDDVHLLPDGVHPYEEGDELMGERFVEKVAGVYIRQP